MQNPANALCAIVAQLKDADGRVTIPGFYDDVRPLSARERENFATSPFNEKSFIAESGSPIAWGEKGFSTLERITVRPTLDVNGIWSGYTGEGSKTVLPFIAHAKVSMRLVPDQDHARIFANLDAFLKRVAPPGVTARLTDLHSAPPYLTEPDSPALDAARRALGRSWGKPAVIIRDGRSIPVMATFAETH